MDDTRGVGPISGWVVAAPIGGIMAFMVLVGLTR